MYRVLGTLFFIHCLLVKGMLFEAEWIIMCVYVKGLHIESQTGPESIHVTWHTKCLTNRVLGKVMRDPCLCPDTLLYASFMCTLQSAIKHGSTVSQIFVSYSSEFVEHEEAVIRTYCLLVRNMGHKLKVWVTYRIDLINCKN